jgi:hypothetical protein
VSGAAKRTLARVPGAARFYQLTCRSRRRAHTTPPQPGPQLGHAKVDATLNVYTQVIDAGSGPRDCKSAANRSRLFQRRRGEDADTSSPHASLDTLLSRLRLINFDGGFPRELHERDTAVREEETE